MGGFFGLRALRGQLLRARALRTFFVARGLELLLVLLAFDLQRTFFADQAGFEQLFA